MNSDFARNITLRRKEKHITQKQAAADLGISQALLSHYEKGIRECGLEFLVKIADYYNVSCDSLLGRSSTAGSSPDEENGTGVSSEVLCEAVNQLLTDAEKSGSGRAAEEVSGCLMLKVYKLSRMLHGGSDKFGIPARAAEKYADAVIAVNEADIEESAGTIFSGTDMSQALRLVISRSEEKINEFLSSGK